MKKVLIFSLAFGVSYANAQQQYLTTQQYYDINTNTLNNHIIPQYKNFADNMDKWQSSVKSLCNNPSPSTLKQTRADFKYVANGWSSVMAINLGSINAFDSYKKFDFWPDKKSFIARGLKKTIKKKPADVFDKIMNGKATPVLMSFNSSERLLFKSDIVIKDKYACKLLLTQASYAKKRSDEVLADWQSDNGYKSEFTPTELSDNEPHISASSEVFKMAMLGLQLIADKAIGEPLSKKKKKGRPFFAQYPNAKMSKLAVQGMYNSSRDLVLNVFKDIIIKQNGQKNYNRLVKLFDKGQNAINSLDKDIYTLASTKDGRKKLAKVQKTISMLRLVAVREINMALSIPLGFNGLDGD